MTDAATLIAEATGHRHGVLVPPTEIPRTPADPSDVHHASVAFEGRGLQSAGGGVGRTVDVARIAAVAEALERYCATHVTLPLAKADMLESKAPGEAHVGMNEFALHSDEQRDDPAYPHGDALGADAWLTRCFRLVDNAATWVPAALVSLTADFGALATSSGLAADPNPTKAILRGLQEIVERDAAMTTWVHGLGGRLVFDGPADERLGGSLRLYDITPAFSPHPVALAAGTLMLDGRARHSIGMACRSTWAEAAERATLEFLQGTLFVGHLLHRQPALVGMPVEAVTGFDEHAVYYGANPDQWAALPLHRHAKWASAPVDATAVGAAADELHELVTTLTDNGVRLFYRELTTVDLNQLGLHVVRVLSPDLTPIHHNHNWPFLGGRAADVSWRYPDAADRASGEPYPSRFPHALG